MTKKQGVILKGNEFGASRRALPAEQTPPQVVDLLDLEPMLARQAIKERIRQAGQTLRRVRNPKELAALRGAGSSWPAVVHELFEHGAYKPTRSRPAAPSGRELDQMDEVLGWLFWVDADARPVVCARVMDVSFRKIAAVDPAGRSFETVRKVFDQAVSDILAHLLAEAEGDL